MPKYIPTKDDVYEIKPCVMCGKDTGYANKDTCSFECEQEKEYFTDYLNNELSLWIDKHE